MKVLVLLVVVGLAAAQEELPDIMIGDPNNSTTDELGEPLSELEFEAGLRITPEDLEEDPIAKSGFYEGDIMLEDEDRLYQLLDGEVGQMSAIRNPSLLWSDGVIPYVISSTFSSSERAIIARAMSEFHSNTCIRFVPRSSHRDYVHILRGQGCSSAVGRSGGSQVLSLGNGCVHLGVIIHELMHAAGFWHEQSRSDRDSYVTINWSNIHQRLRFNFDKKSLSVTQNLGLDYDYGSIMHYGPYAFAINYQYPTITPRQSGVTIGQRKGFSAVDIESLRRLYRCEGTTTTKPSPANCVDNHRFCESWSSQGYCNSNPGYMKVYCKKSCGECGGTTGNCVDTGEFCDDWAAKGECTRNKGYMEIGCPKTCGFCSGRGTVAPKKCTDDNQFCSDWASKGECTRNAGFMKVGCRKSCQLC